MGVLQGPAAKNNVLMLLYGISALVLGPTLPGIIVDLDLSLGEAGFIGSVQNAGGMVGALVCVFAADRVHAPAAALGSFFLLGVSLILIGSAGSYHLLLAAFVSMGLWIRVLDVMLNAHTATVGGRRGASRLSLLHMFFSLGAFAGPLVTRAILSTEAQWNLVYTSLGLVFCGLVPASSPWLGGYLHSVPAPETVRGMKAGHPAPDALRGRRVVRAMGPAAVVLLLYAIHQVGISSWLPYYLETVRLFPPDRAGFALSMYWIGIIAGRLAAARWADTLGVRRFLAIGLGAGAGATAVCILVPHGATAMVAALVAGACAGATIPLTFSQVYRTMPARKGAVTAVLSLAMLAGRLLGPWVVGALGDLAGLTLSMPLTALVLLPAAVAAGATVPPLAAKERTR